MHRYLRQLVEQCGIDAGIPLGDIRQDSELVESVLSRLREQSQRDQARSEASDGGAGLSQRGDRPEDGIRCSIAVHGPEPVEPEERLRSENGHCTAQRRGDHKILVLSDLHIPFTCNPMLEEAFHEHGDADEVVLLGDIWDMYAVSRFGKDRQIDVVEELEIGTRLITDLLERFPKVVVVLGNHDTRPVRWVERENPQMLPLVLSPLEYVKYRLVTEHREHLLERLVTPTYTVSGSHPEYPIMTNHVYLVGDALLGHFEVSRKGPANTVYRLALEWLPFWGPMIGADGIRVLVQGHVHRLSKSQYGPYLLIESGCCAHLMGYTVRAPLSYSVPGVGYVVLYQRDGVTDFNRSGYYVYQEIYR
jgi:predicted phosphodiesterase